MTNKVLFILHETIHEIGYVWLCYRTLYPGCHIAAWSSFSPTFSSSLAGQVHPHTFLPFRVHLGLVFVALLSQKYSCEFSLPQPG